MIQIILNLKKILKEKRLSPEQASGYIGCSGNQIRRWIKGTSKPSPIYREAIQNGIEKILRDAL
jgi:transcriptional regulator with XRE-family HTH domain